MCIFAYGQTGSGKTHTMLGTDIESAEGRGINFRALEDLFELGRQRQDEASSLQGSKKLDCACAALCVLYKQHLACSSRRRSRVNSAA